MDAYTIPINNCIIVIKNNLDWYQTIVALFHELAHVYDFIEFSQKYKICIEDIRNHKLFEALKLYSETNAYYLGNKLALEFLNQKNSMMKQFFCNYVKPIDVRLDALRKNQLPVDELFQSVGYLLFYGYLYCSEDYLSLLPDFVSDNRRKIVDSILNAYFSHDVEIVSHTIDQLFPVK